MIACGHASPLLLIAAVVWFALPAIALGALTTVAFRPGLAARSINFVAGMTAVLGGLNVMAGATLVWPLMMIGVAEILMALVILYRNRRV